MRDRAIKEIYSKVMEDLLREKDFLEIKTTEIIERSGLSRATFYKYFRDKYELSAWKFSVLFIDDLIPHECVSMEISRRNYIEHTRYICEHKEIYSNLFKYSGQNSFENYYVEFAIEVAEDVAQQAGRKLRPYDYYLIKYHASGAIRVLKEWMQSDSPISVDELCDLLIMNRSDEVERLYVVHDK